MVRTPMRTPVTTNTAPLPPWLQQPGLFSARPVNAADADSAVRRWVDVTDSMTSAIARHFGDDPAVRVLHSGSAELHAWEHQLLQNAATATTFARHIVLCIDTRPVLAARSVTCSILVQQELTALRETPLARRLFESDLWQRYTPAQPLLTGDGTYGRACGWRYDNGNSTHTLLVEEYFLPPLLAATG